MSNPLPPTPDQMRQFARRFTQDDYHYLCADPLFTDTITDDLPLCGMIAERLLKLRERGKHVPKEIHPNSNVPRKR